MAARAQFPAHQTWFLQSEGRSADSFFLTGLGLRFAVSYCFYLLSLGPLGSLGARHASSTRGAGGRSCTSLPDSGPLPPLPPCPLPSSRPTQSTPRGDTTSPVPPLLVSRRRPGLPWKSPCRARGGDLDLSCGQGSGLGFLSS